MAQPDRQNPDELDWDSTTKPGTRDGEGQKRMVMFHASDDAVPTVPYEPGNGDD